MQINQFYVIRTGYCHKESGDKKINWYDSVMNMKTKCGYRHFQFHPFEYPVFTTFEEADQACRSDWNDLMYENCDNYAKVCEYTMSSIGIWNLTHEWIYSTEDNFDIKIPIENENGIYTLFSEATFSDEEEKISEKIYKIESDNPF